LSARIPERKLARENAARVPDSRRRSQPRAIMRRRRAGTALVQSILDECKIEKRRADGTRAVPFSNPPFSSCHDRLERFSARLGERVAVAERVRLPQEPTAGEPDDAAPQFDPREPNKVGVGAELHHGHGLARASHVELLKNNESRPLRTVESRLERNT